MVFAGQVERMTGLHGRHGMLVDQLHLPAALEDQRELIETGHRALQHYAIDQNTVIGSCSRDAACRNRSWSIAFIAALPARMLQVGENSPA